MGSSFLLICIGLLCASPALAQFRLANGYSDQMVLQMTPKSSKVWGYGTAGSSVSVQLNNGATIGTTVAGDGTWSVRLPAQAAGGPYPLRASDGTSEVTINVWFGDVWVCSGQSNMEMPISQMMDPAGETAKAVTYQNIRLMQVSNQVSTTELQELGSISLAWSAPTDQNVPGFSALCLMFGERMSDFNSNARPIGLIDTTWGGTRIEAWSSTRVTAACNTPPNTSGDANGDHNLWNSMVSPLTNMAVRGAIWYQGESNTGYNSDYYACHMQNLVDDWRNTFVDGAVPVPSERNVAFPFGIVQIGPTDGGTASNYGYLRWHQSTDIGYLPNSNLPEAFMAAAYDTTDRTSPTGDIHPRDKPTIADRLSNAAKTVLYTANFLTNGPMPVSISAVVNNAVTITYDMDIAVNTAYPGFTMLDGSWVDTTIVSTSGRDVTVSVSATATQLAYAWKSTVCEYKACAIYSQDAQALPAQVWIWNLAVASK